MYYGRSSGRILEEKQKTNIIMAKVDKYIILSYDSLCNFIGYLSAYTASGANQFASQIHQAITFDKSSDCIYSHGQEWEEGNGKKGHYELRIHQVEENNLNEFEQKILEVFKLPFSYDSDGQFITDAQGKKVSDIRGWGVLQYQKNNPELLQDTLGEMLVKAFNEKYSKK
jgi:hypothetical protein